MSSYVDIVYLCCHSEGVIATEESHKEILRFAQDDNLKINILSCLHLRFTRGSRASS